MSFEDYRERRAILSDADIRMRSQAKEYELEVLWKELGLSFEQPVVRVAVLGCADKRSIPDHKSIFQRLTGKAIDMTTFDIDARHLNEAENVVEHDCTSPLPDGPYDIAYGHILLKFMPPEKQWQVLQNSFKSLRKGGVGIHIMDFQGRSAATDMLTRGFYEIPLKEFEKKLEEQGAQYKEISIPASHALIKNETGLVLINHDNPGNL